MAKGVSEYVGITVLMVAMTLFAILAMDWISALRQEYAKAVEEVQEGKELLYVYRNGSQLIVSNGWGRISKVVALIYVYSPHNVPTCSNAKIFEDLGLALQRINDTKIDSFASLALDPCLARDVERICVVTSYGNVFCSQPISTLIGSGNGNGVGGDQGSENDGSGERGSDAEDPRALALLAQILPPDLYQSITSRYRVVDYTIAKLPAYIYVYATHRVDYHLGKRWTSASVRLQFWGSTVRNIDLGTTECSIDADSCNHTRVVELASFGDVAKLLLRVVINVSVERASKGDTLKEVDDLYVRTYLELVPINRSYKLLIVYDRARNDDDSGLYPVKWTSYDIEIFRGYVDHYDWNDPNPDENWTYPRNLWRNRFVSLYGKEGYYTIGKLGFYTEVGIETWFEWHVASEPGFLTKLTTSWLVLFTDRNPAPDRYHAVLVFMLQERS